MVRDVKEYYAQVTKDYNLMREELKDMEELCKEKVVAPEMVENMKQMILPIKTNYETLSYFMFLLNKPAKKDKQERYINQNKKLIEASKGRTKEDILKEDKETLKNLHNLNEEVRND